jgi:glycine/D-amino acid oxidase-like deaminating enzyme
MKERVLVIGGGFFGLFLGEHLAKRGFQVSIIEKENEVMQRASYANQARVHNGYHYPRSVLTALRARISFPRFVNEFKSCIDDQFDKYYMVGKLLGKVTAKQFEKFCAAIGAPCDRVAGDGSWMMNPNLVEAVYRTTEYAFNSVKLKEAMKLRLAESGASVFLGRKANSVRVTGGKLSVTIRDEASDGVYVESGYSHVFNCTYSTINAINAESGLEIIPLKHEMTEICLVSVPKELKHVGITVMCGPFFSLMPFPALDCHALTHVRYTPHLEWQDVPGRSPADWLNDGKLNGERKSSWGWMWRDAARYIPLLAELKYIRSLWEVKTVLPRSESDDSRPILFKADHGLRGFHCIMGGKIDNVYDAVEQVDGLLAAAR